MGKWITDEEAAAGVTTPTSPAHSIFVDTDGILKKRAHTTGTLTTIGLANLTTDHLYRGVAGVTVEFEIGDLVEKVTPVTTDWMLLTDSAAGDVLKKVDPVNLGAGGSPHDLLSATHPDTLAAAVSRGSLVFGNATPKWAELVVGTGLLKADGTDVSGWSLLATADVADDAIVYGKIQNVVADDVFLGNIAGAGGIVAELTGTQATVLLDVLTDALQGLAPASGGGTANFLRADQTWAVPVGASEINALVADGISGIADNQLAVGTGGGTAAYLTISNGAMAWNGTVFAQAALADLSDVSGDTGTGATVVFDTSPTIVTPTIASFANAAHDHTDAAGGAQIAASTALSDFATLALLAGTQTFAGDKTFTGKLIVPVGKTTVTVGEVTVDNTLDQFIYRTDGGEFARPPGDGAAVSIQDPATGKKFIMLDTRDGAITLKRVSSCQIGGTSVAWELRYDPDPTAIGTLIVGVTTSVSTSMTQTTSFTDATVPANNAVWIETDTVTGSVTNFFAKMFYDFDRA